MPLPPAQMRRLLADHGRIPGSETRRRTQGRLRRDQLHGSPLANCEFEEVNDLLERLQRIDPDAARVVEMKFFSGMTDEEVAVEIGRSHSTVRRHWNFAKAWLVRQNVPDTPEMKKVDQIEAVFPLIGRERQHKEKSFCH